MHSAKFSVFTNHCKMCCTRRCCRGNDLTLNTKAALLVMLCLQCACPLCDAGGAAPPLGNSVSLSIRHTKHTGINLYIYYFGAGFFPKYAISVTVLFQRLGVGWVFERGGGGWGGQIISEHFHQTYMKWVLLETLCYVLRLVMCLCAVCEGMWCVCVLCVKACDVSVFCVWSLPVCECMVCMKVCGMCVLCVKACNAFVCCVWKFTF